MGIKLVAADMDGTLLNSRKELPPDFMDWVKAHKEIRMVIASGRQYAALAMDFEPIRDGLLFVAENGSLVMYHDEVLYLDEMRKKDIAFCLDFVKQIADANPVVCGVRDAYIQNPDEETLSNARIYYKRLEVVDDLKEAMYREPIVKITCYIRGHRAQETYPLFSALDKRFASVLSGDCWIDMSPPGASKGQAVRAIQSRYGIAPEECMAFGDYLNDYTLLQVCGESYCMANGHEELKAIARHIAPSNDEDGVMRILRAL